MTVLDANAVLRFLLRDIEEQARATKEIIVSADCVITVEVIAEVVYVLSGFYKLGRVKIANKILELVAIKNGLVEKHTIVSYAVSLFATNTKLDFIDCLLAGYQKTANYNVYTFDKELKKQLAAG